MYMPKKKQRNTRGLLVHEGMRWTEKKKKSEKIEIDKTNEIRNKEKQKIVKESKKYLMLGQEEVMFDVNKMNKKQT